MDESGAAQISQDNGPDRGSHVAGRSHDYSSGLEDGDRHGAAGRRGVDPDVSGRSAGTGQGILTRDDPAISQPQGQSGA